MWEVCSLMTDKHFLVCVGVVYDLQQIDIHVYDTFYIIC